VLRLKRRATVPANNAQRLSLVIPIAAKSVPRKRICNATDPREESGQSHRRGNDMHESADANAQRGNKTGAPAQTDAAARYVEHGRARYRQQDQGCAHKKQQRRMIGNHGC